MTDTIHAVATAPGRSAVAVIRISGPKARAFLAGLGVERIQPRRASLRRLRAGDGRALDDALVLWFPCPDSYTGEDSGELHVHGGPAIVSAVDDALRALGSRSAEPGEFTRRAFENGKLDLAQAEAVADLVDAETEAQARQALSQLRGALGRRHESWREGLVQALARLEAAVDFPDEDLPEDVQKQSLEPIDRLIADLTTALGGAARGRQIRDGYRVAIIGAPNAGKSTLLNALLQRNAAIVADTPGSTRDVLETWLFLAGYKVLLADMAGLREVHEAVEREGVRRARDWADTADFRLCVIDTADPTEAWREAQGHVWPGDLVVFNKADLPISQAGHAAKVWVETDGLESLEVSLAGDGADVVRRRLQARVVADLSGGEFPAATRLRHEALLRDALDHLARARNTMAEPELAAEDVRLAARALGRVTGAVGVEDVLGEVFARFCIGK